MLAEGDNAITGTLDGQAIVCAVGEELCGSKHGVVLWSLWTVRVIGQSIAQGVGCQASIYGTCHMAQWHLPSLRIAITWSAIGIVAQTH